jgi:CDP-paratose 2-epimerase
MKEQDRFRSVLIFGGAGFIGSNWAHRLLETSEAKVHVFDNLSRHGVRHNLESLQRAAGKSGRLQITVGDVRDAASVERVARHATEIYNFAAQVAVTTSIQDPRLDFQVNAQGTFNVLEGARKSGNLPFLLFTSTNKVYGDLGIRQLRGTLKRYVLEGCGVSETQPLDFHSPYGCSKGAADQYVRDYARIYDLPSLVLRMSCIAGPRQFGNEEQGWVAHFVYSALTGAPLTIYGDGRQLRDVLCVHDLLRVFETVREHKAVIPGQVYNVGGGPQNTISLLELIDEIECFTGRRLHYELEESRPGDQLAYVTNFAKLHHDTGWTPQYSVRDTVAEIYRWWQRNRQLLAPARVPARLAARGWEELPEAAA